jgi:hypothetical protein
MPAVILRCHGGERAKLVTDSGTRVLDRDPAPIEWSALHPDLPRQIGCAGLPATEPVRRNGRLPACPNNAPRLAHEPRPDQPERGRVTARLAGDVRPRHVDESVLERPRPLVPIVTAAALLDRLPQQRVARPGRAHRPLRPRKSPLRLAITKAWAGSLLPDEPGIIEVTFRGVDTATGQEHTATVELTCPATQFLVTCQPTTVLGSLALRAISIREQQTPSGWAPSDGFVTDVFEDFGSIFGGDSCRIVPEGDHLTLTCALGITNRALSQPGGGSGGGSAGAGGDHGTLGDDTGADGAGSSGSTRADRHGRSPPNPGPPPDQAGSPARQAIVPVSPPTTTDAESSRSGRESEPAVSGYQLLAVAGRPQVSRPALFWLILGLVNAAIGLQLGRRGTTRTR